MLMKPREKNKAASLEDAIQMMREDFERKTDELKRQFEKTVVASKKETDNQLDRWGWIISTVGMDAVDFIRKDLERRADGFRVQWNKAMINGKKAIEDHPILALGVLAAEAVVLELLSDLLPSKE
jgi:hypothetical protein